MAVFKCEDCGGKVSTEAAVCPHCGHPNRGKREKARTTKKSTMAFGCLIIVAAFIAIGVVSSKFSSENSSNYVRASNTPAKIEKYNNTLYAKGQVNIRSGPTLESQVVRSANKGEALQINAKKGEWFRLAESDSNNEFWVHNSVISASYSSAIAEPKEEKAQNSTSKSSSPNAAGLLHISASNYFGSTDKKYFEKLSNYAVQQDIEAFREGLAAGILAGICTTFKEGEPVYISGTSIFSGLVKVRRKGEVQEYWTNVEAVR